QEIEPEQRAAEGEPADAESGQHGAERIERVWCLRPHVLDEEGRQHDAGKPDRDVDQEDPVPGDVGGDKSAERRAEQRPDQRRQRPPDHRIPQLALVGAAPQNEPATGVIIAPPMPCTMRAATNSLSEPDNAQPIEPSMNTAMAARNTVRAPKRSAVQPLIGMITASERR